MPNKFGAVEKIYSIKTTGIDALLKELSSVRQEFQKVATAKKDLDRQMSQVQDAGALKALQKEVDTLKAKEDQLTQSLASLQKQLQGVSNLQALEVERSRNGGQAAESALGAYQRLAKQYKEAKQSLEDLAAEHGVESKEALAAADSLAVLKSS